MLRIKQYLCKHDFKYLAEHMSTQQNLWKCDKCNVYCIQHWGIGTYYNAKTPHIEGWIYRTKIKRDDPIVPATKLK
jgi:hypothetical protein